MRPVMNEARPAVQLACPYQDVNIAPSLAMRSTFGVGWPRAAPPPEYAPKSFQPVSSVISMTMLGFLSPAPAGPVAIGASRAASNMEYTVTACFMFVPPSDSRSGGLPSRRRRLGRAVLPGENPCRAGPHDPLVVATRIEHEPEDRRQRILCHSSSGFATGVGPDGARAPRTAIR